MMVNPYECVPMLRLCLSSDNQPSRNALHSTDLLILSHNCQNWRIGWRLQIVTVSPSRAKQEHMVKLLP